MPLHTRLYSLITLKSDLSEKVLWYILTIRCPASQYTANYNQALVEKHKSAMEQLIHRDRNHANVVMWSIANEPRTGQLNDGSYFQ